MAEPIIVYVNDMPVKILQGMKVRHALISSDYELFRAVDQFDLVVEDENGNLLDTEGAISEGAKIYTKVLEDF